MVARVVEPVEQKFWPSHHRIRAHPHLFLLLLHVSVLSFVVGGNSRRSSGTPEAEQPNTKSHDEQR